MKSLHYVKQTELGYTMRVARAAMCGRRRTKRMRYSANWALVDCKLCWAAEARRIDKEIDRDGT